MAIVHKFVVGGAKGYINIGVYEDGSVGEVFLKLNRSKDNGWTNCIGILISTALQRGVPLEDIIKKLEFQRFEPSGPTKNPRIPMAHSICDYVARYLKVEFLEKGKVNGEATPAGI